MHGAQVLGSVLAWPIRIDGARRHVQTIRDDEHHSWGKALASSVPCIRRCGVVPDARYFVTKPFVRRVKRRDRSDRHSLQTREYLVLEYLVLDEESDHRRPSLLSTGSTSTRSSRARAGCNALNRFAASVCNRSLSRPMSMDRVILVFRPDPLRYLLVGAEVDTKNGARESIHS